MKARGVSSFCLVVLTASAWSAAAGDPGWRVVRGEVRVVCPMTVGGSFEARTGAVGGSLHGSGSGPSSLDGDLTVDLTTLDTGIGLRNDHLRGEYLEVGRGEGFDKAVLSEIHLAEVDSASFQGRTTFTGTFLVHGTKHTIVGRAEIRREGTSVRVDATFPLTIADYGIPKPQYLGVGVKEQVEVRASLVAMPVAGSEGAGR